ncbi:FAD/NAD(P)-binding protein [Arenibaculum pallidiluteum]|uniref:FAD/NAD(P)-binding protein n=1 Tax=Arenibaculum pallidiluteum TaxID=2812559 RepID=UPI001A970607|nr:FAD/NAD(P)-binding protein [Arenibaculum pallidiluteum]
MTTRPRVAIVGAGFCGSLLAIHLMERCRDGVQVLLFERGHSFARGMAYSTSNPGHLLNAPAGRMSAFPDRPGHFVDWLRTLPKGFCPSLPDQVGEDAFVSRRLYGAYLQHLLGEAVWRQGSRSRLDLVTDEVTALAEAPGGMSLTTAMGRTYAAEVVALAAGNLPPVPPPVEDPSFYRTPLYRNDPWAPGALDGLGSEAPVLLIGTGLSMVDALISLLDHGHRGPVHALSRRGLLPRPHTPGLIAPRTLDPRRLGGGVAGLLRLLREEARAAEAAGGDWRSAVDALRPHLPAIWQGLPDAERRRFLRHLRPWWDVHRHRMAPGVAARVSDALARGQLRIHTGRIERYQPQEHGVAVGYRSRGGVPASIAVARVINCTGPAMDPARTEDPLLSAMLTSGLAMPGDLGLGIGTTAEGRVIGGDGGAHSNLYAVGPLTRERFWESTAVAEIRAQIVTLAGHVAERLEGRDLIPGGSGRNSAWPPAPLATSSGARVVRERVRLALENGRCAERTVTIRFAPRPVVIVRKERPWGRSVPFERVATAVFERFLDGVCEPDDVLWFEESPVPDGRFASVRMRADRRRHVYGAARFQRLSEGVPLELDSWYCESGLFT